jgi:hypothetical protein
MILDSLAEFRIYHNHHDAHNKVWGFFLHGVHLWAFWGGMGKAWSFKYHGGDLPWIRSTLYDLANKKMSKGYVIVSDPHMLDSLDSTWRDRFNERFTYFLLQQTYM